MADTVWHHNRSPLSTSLNAVNGRKFASCVSLKGLMKPSKTRCNPWLVSQWAIVLKSEPKSPGTAFTRPRPKAGSRVLKWARFVCLFYYSGQKAAPSHKMQMFFFCRSFCRCRRRRRTFEIAQYGPYTSTVLYRQNGRRLPGLFV